MGALHPGHASLVERAIRENDHTVVSIFVNPTQFDRQEDLDNYPNTLTSDLEILDKLGCDTVFTPSVSEIYNDDVKAEAMDFNGLDQVMEGHYRKGHFEGVGTIVKRLLEIVGPTRAYFGEKDYQQLMIIRVMTKKYDLPVEIIGCPIHREADGLAMSSRNTLLTEAQRAAAPVIFKVLQGIRDKLRSGNIDAVKSWVRDEINKEPELRLEYIEIVDETTLRASDPEHSEAQRAFIAVFAGDIRLIDNKKITG
jgi:pantoate--beta-alanine ligase